MFVVGFLWFSARLVVEMILMVALGFQSGNAQRQEFGGASFATLKSASVPVRKARCAALQADATAIQSNQCSPLIEQKT